MKKIILILVTLLSSLTTFAQWQLTSGPLSAGHISSMTVKDSTVFAGTETGGVFVTIDQGNSWIPANNGLTNLNDVRAMIADSTYLFAGLYNSLSGTAVFSTTNDGASWSPSGLSFIFFWSFAMKPGYLIAGTWYGVSVSTNNGSTWNSFITGLPSNASVAALAYAGTKLFGGVTSSSVGGTGVFYSTNNGTSWNAFNTGLTTTVVNKLAVVGSNVFAGTSGGVSVSSTAAANWSTANTGLTNLNIRSFFSWGGILFAGTGDGIFFTADNGANWVDISAGLPAVKNVYSITSDTNYLYVGTDSAVYRRPMGEIISGITEHKTLSSMVNVYPNPAATSLTISVSNLQPGKEKYDISIFTFPGEKMLQHSLSQAKTSLDISNLSPGIYFIRITDSSGKSETKKLVKM